MVIYDLSPTDDDTSTAAVKEVGPLYIEQTHDCGFKSIDDFLAGGTIENTWISSIVLKKSERKRRRLVKERNQNEIILFVKELPFG